MLDFGDGPVPYIGGPEAYHFGRRSFPFGAIKSVQKGESTAAGGRVEGPVPYDGANQYSNVGYPVTNGGQTGLDDGPFPYDGAKPVSIDFSPRGPVPYDDDTQYANAAPINAGQPGTAPGGLYDRPDPYGGAKPVSIKVAPSGRVDGPVLFGGDTQYRNAGYPVTKKGETGRSTAYGPVPYGSASHYTNADPTKDGQSGNPGSIPSGAAPEVISYGYGFYPFGNMDVADRNTAASGRVDGPVPFGGDTEYANAAPINAGQTGSNPAATGGLYDGPDPNSGATRYPNANPLSINIAPSGLVDGPVPFGGDTQYSNAGYDVTKEGQTGLYDGATRYANAKPVSKESQSGNPGSIPSGAAPEVIPYGYGFYPFGNMDGQSGNPISIPSGAAPEVISYGYGFYPFGNMDAADRNTAASGRVDGPVPFGGDIQYANAAPINAGQTGSNPAAPGGLYDRPDPNSGATRYPNANPLSINSQSGNPGSFPSGAAPEVISYGYGGYPFGNMDVAPHGRVDGPLPFGGDTRYVNAAPINGGQTRSNPGGLDDGTGPLGGATHSSNVGYPVTNKDQTSINTADGPVPYEPTYPVVFPWAKTSFMKPNNWRPPSWGFTQWEPIPETPASDKSPQLSSSYIVQSSNSYQREKEDFSHSSFSDGPPDSEVFVAPRRRKTPGSLSIAGTNVF
ncbi:hypothetical protein CgunFtcFv8_012576 [Champsocephalus gunnari]|uniref:Uncharacterized protein n=1 Tax=Champsocephalus gunnari TaxID=52237 RepID=A0AAN8DSQ4_CHAGU|nr:hypothetical protein CgunFtcFv8_012576 [Champsocephalus gunnari]